MGPKTAAVLRAVIDGADTSARIVEVTSIKRVSVISRLNYLAERGMIELFGVVRTERRGAPMYRWRHILRKTPWTSFGKELEGADPATGINLAKR